MWQYTGQQRPPFAIEPGPAQESVWDYPRPPGLVPDSRRVLVYQEEHIIADSQRSVRILETASPPTFYIPADDIDMDALVNASGSSFCEWKGQARYWALKTQSDSVVGWDYPQPTPAFAEIADHLSFYPGRLACYVDDERVQAQTGGFYGGWVTSEIIGPYKGEPNTGHW